MRKNINSLRKVNQMGFGGGIKKGLPDQNDLHRNSPRLKEIYYNRYKDHSIGWIDRLFKTDSYIFKYISNIYSYDY